MPRDPKVTHELDQMVAAFGTLGSAYGVFIREARSAGATPKQAQDGATSAIYAWFGHAIDRERMEREFREREGGFDR